MITRHDLTHEHLHDVLHRKNKVAKDKRSATNPDDGVLDSSSPISRAFSFRNSNN